MWKFQEIYIRIEGKFVWGCNRVIGEENDAKTGIITTFIIKRKGLKEEESQYEYHPLWNRMIKTVWCCSLIQWYVWESQVATYAAQWFLILSMNVWMSWVLKEFQALRRSVFNPGTGLGVCGRGLQDAYLIHISYISLMHISRAYLTHALLDSDEGSWQATACAGHLFEGNRRPGSYGQEARYPPWICNQEQRHNETDER